MIYVATLSVRQPWASLIVSGIKRVEIRSKQTPHRGLLVIHSSAFIDHDDRLPRGAMIGVARLFDVVQLEGGRYGWLLEAAMPFSEPIQARGRLGIYRSELTGKLAQQIALCCGTRGTNGTEEKRTEA